VPEPPASSRGPGRPGVPQGTFAKSRAQRRPVPGRGGEFHRDALEGLRWPLRMRSTRPRPTRKGNGRGQDPRGTRPAIEGQTARPVEGSRQHPAQSTRGPGQCEGRRDLPGRPRHPGRRGAGDPGRGRGARRRVAAAEAREVKLGGRARWSLRRPIDPPPRPDPSD
jgi:hypothetical protein